MTTEAQAYEGLREIFADVFVRDDIALSGSMTAKDVEGWDSFKQIEIIMAAEERFSLRFTSAEIDRFARLDDLVAVIVSRGRHP